MITFNKKNSPSNKSIFIISSNDKSYISTNNNRNNTKVVAKKIKVILHSDTYNSNKHKHYINNLKKYI